MNALYARRRRKNAVLIALSMAATSVGLLWLALILFSLLSNGLAAIGPDLFTTMTPPPGSQGTVFAAAIAASSRL